MAKVMAPAPPVGYVHRASLLKRIDAVLDRRLTVLQAPGGFGKTTVLADVSHRKKKAGLVVAWLSLDQDDSPDVFGNYLALAFEHAGLDLAALNDEKDGCRTRTPGKWGCWLARYSCTPTRVC